LWAIPTYWSQWWTRIWSGRCPWFMNIKWPTSILHTLAWVWHEWTHLGTNKSFNEHYRKGEKIPSMTFKQTKGHSLWNLLLEREVMW
jgi:hypothetical protein